MKDNNEHNSPNQTPVLEKIIQALNEQNEMAREAIHSIENRINKIEKYNEPTEPKEPECGTKSTEPITVIERLINILQNNDHNNSRLRLLDDRIGKLVG